MVGLSVTVRTSDQQILAIDEDLAKCFGHQSGNLMGRFFREIFTGPHETQLDLLFSPPVLLAERGDGVEVRFLVLGDPPSHLTVVDVRHGEGGVAVVTFASPLAVAEQQVTDLEHRYSALVRASTDGVVVHDGIRVLFANDAAVDLVGLGRHVERVGRAIADFIRVEDRDSLAEVRRRLTDQPTSQQRITLRLVQTSGSIAAVEATFARVTWEGLEAIQVVLHDLRRVHGASPLQLVDERELEVVGEATITTDALSRIVHWSSAATVMYGWTQEEVLGRGICDVLGIPRLILPHGEVAPGFGSDVWRGLVRHKHLDGHTFMVDSTVRILRDANDVVEGLLVVDRRARDLADVEACDRLTGLTGRSSMLACLDGAVKSSTSLLVLIDIDNFRGLNARLGSEAGDEVLVGLAARLSSMVRGADSVFHLGADRFAIHAVVQDRDEALIVAGRLERLVSEPLDVGGGLLSVAARLGAAWGPSGGDAGKLVVQAESALRKAGASGGRRLCVYDPGTDEVEWGDDAIFATEIREALATGAIHVAYQPIVELSTGRVRMLEALARWDHPVRGAVAPNDFIPLAERCGAIEELGLWILTRACEDVVKLGADGISVGVSVNMSVVQLRNPLIAEQVAAALASAGLPAERLWIEVTEGVLVDDQALLPLYQIHDLGVHLTIDDFGTGYASFQYITRLPVDTLKIDSSFVAGLGIIPGDTAVVRSVIGLGRELGLHIVAEGVETESQRSLLVDLDCRLGQGWLFARAVSAADFLALHRASARHGLGSVAPAAQESLRLAALHASRVLDTSPDPAFDALVRLASQLLSSPVALVTLIDADRLWFKARVGTNRRELQRDSAFYGHVLTDPHLPLIVGDATADPRFADNPMVVGPPHIRAYAGVPIRSREGLPIGTVCVIDFCPRTFTDTQIEQLSMLAEQAAALINLRRRAAELTDLNQRSRLSLDDNADAISVSPSRTMSADEVGRVVSELSLIDGPRTLHFSEPSASLAFESLDLDITARTVSKDGADIPLTDKEFDLLAFLAARAGHAFSRSELLQHVWHSTADWQAPATVTEHVYRLRRKIEDVPAKPQLLRTVRGIGYCFGPLHSEHASDEGLPLADAAPRTGTMTTVGRDIVDVDDAMLSLLGARDRADVIGREFFDFVAPSSHPAAATRLEMRARGQVPGPQVITMLAIDREPIVALLSSTPVELDGQQAIVSSFSEIVDRPQLIRQMVTGVVSEVSDAVMVTDPDLHILSWNSAAQRLYGWSEPEVLGHTLSDVVRANSGPQVVVGAWDVLQAAGRWHGRVEQVTRDGSIVTVFASVSLVRGDRGEVTCIVAVNRPVEATGSGASHPVALIDGAQIASGMERNEFVVFFEAIVDLNNRRAATVEARIRWMRPDGDVWESSHFMEAIERAGATLRFADFVCDALCLQVERWKASGQDLDVAVDVRAAHLTEPGFVAVLLRTVTRLDAVGCVLSLEIAEQEVAEADEATYDVLHTLVAAGARITIGDFGAGTPSVASLSRVQVHSFKMGAALVSRLPTDRRAVDVARSFVALGSELGVEVAAEGVGSEAEHDILTRLGCTRAQGAFYLLPAPSETLHLERTSEGAR